MNEKLYSDAKQIIEYSINEVLPSKCMGKVLANYSNPKGKTVLISIGKAAYTMAKETSSQIDIDEGLILTKYGHAGAPLKNIKTIEAGHPFPDENSIFGANKAIEMCSNLSSDDVVIMLISGGASSLFESPLIELKDLQFVNEQLIKCGASINEINTIRKRLSKVKGGKFAKICEPAKVINIVLSDVANNSLDVIASGPTYQDTSTLDDALKVISKYDLHFNDNIISTIKNDTTLTINNVNTYIIANNENLKLAAKKKAELLGYKVIYIKEPILFDIDKAVKYFKSLIKEYLNSDSSVCIISGGEIVINVTGNGMGGRNQELACRLSEFISNTNSCFFAVGSDGTDGPTDAAGAYVDKDNYNLEVYDYLKNNDSYSYLKKYDGLIKTGPTGTNVCDLYCALLPKQ